MKRASALIFGLTDVSLCSPSCLWPILSPRSRRSRQLTDSATPLWISLHVAAAEDLRIWGVPGSSLWSLDVAAADRSFPAFSIPLYPLDPADRKPNTASSYVKAGMSLLSSESLSHFEIFLYFDFLSWCIDAFLITSWLNVKGNRKKNTTLWLQWRWTHLTQSKYTKYKIV